MAVVETFPSKERNIYTWIQTQIKTKNTTGFIEVSDAHCNFEFTKRLPCKTCIGIKAKAFRYISKRSF